MTTMFPGTFRVAHYWSSVPQQTCQVCRETMPLTLFPEMESGARRKKCAACIENRRKELGNRRKPSGDVCEFSLWKNS